mgnify:FL=1
MSKVAPLLQFIVGGKESFSHISRYRPGISHLDIFGMYYIIDTSKTEQKYSVVSASEAAHLLRIDEYESLYHLRSQYLINHKIERYAHEVEITLTQKMRDLKKFQSACSVAVADNITPKVIEIRFENIGEEVVAKIYGSSMWFVYNVSIEGVNGKGKDLQVDLMSSSGSEVQTRMPEANVVHEEEVSVRVKTHFQNSKFLPLTKVPAKTTTYVVSRRQQQLARHSPRGIIELAYLSALLERRPDECHSKRFKAIKTFFKGAVSVVPLESLFHAMATGKPDVVLQCCEILCASAALSKLTPPSEFLRSSVQQASSRVRLLMQHHEHPYLDGNDHMRLVRGTSVGRSFPFIRMQGDNENRGSMFLQQARRTEKYDYNKLINDTYSRINQFMKKTKSVAGKRLSEQSTCTTDLAVIYPSAEVEATRKRKETCCKAPMTLLTEGRKQLNQISEELITELSRSTESSSASNANSMMLSALNGLRKEFETCSTLLGAFMESQAQIPLEKAGGDKYVAKFAKHASSFGLSVWGLLILPFKYLNQLISSNVSEDFRQFVIEFSQQIHDRFHHYVFAPTQRQFPDYDEKLEFLVGSMKQSWTCNRKYVSYSLERQLEEQCKKRNIYHDTPVDEILDQWNDTFENETLTLVPN